MEVGRCTYGFHYRSTSHTKGYDSIWVIIDRFTKSAHFIPVKTIYHAKTYAELYIARIVSLHGVPLTITSDRGSLFVSRFWEQLQHALGTKLIRSSAYHPQTSGQVERVNQILEDMLRACAMTYSTKWDECLPLAEFAYNNSYQKSLEMAPFEALYGKRCRTPLNWSEPGERVTFGPDLVTRAEAQVKMIHNNLKRARSRAEKLLDKRRRPLVFEEGDHVYLRVSPMKGVHRFGVKGKLAPRYVGPFKITERCGSVAYRLELPPHLAAVHDVFHVSQLKKCLRVPEKEIDTSQIQIEPDLTYEEHPIKILDQKQRATRRRAINFYKVQWSNHSEEEATWEQEEFLQTNGAHAAVSRLGRMTTSARGALNPAPRCTGSFGPLPPPLTRSHLSAARGPWTHSTPRPTVPLLLSLARTRRSRPARAARGRATAGRGPRPAPLQLPSKRRKRTYLDAIPAPFALVTLPLSLSRSLFFPKRRAPSPLALSSSSLRRPPRHVPAAETTAITSSVS
ncbi:hypothetical protein U9M48_003909 [Paspalum notatum var. saurae]|uniref:Integrase catalytic domain-containing protein n=1 Tax=Paspalum notatum var. saurae TaxID=547442 RepID=A0AAQ3PUH8_PASNO